MATRWEVRITGNDANGGGFYPSYGGTDYSRQDSPQAVVTVTSLGASLVGAPGTFTSAMVGNFVGDGTINPIKITGFEDDTTVVTDRDPSWTAQVVNIGGALATPGKALGAAIATGTGWKIWTKGANYAATTATANVVGGVLNFNQTGSQTAFNCMEGYTTTQGDGGRFTMTLGSGLNAVVVNMNNANSYNILNNIEIVGNSTNGASAFGISGRSNRLYNFKASGFTGTGQHISSVNSNGSAIRGEISGGNTNNYHAFGIGGGAIARDIWVHGNAGRGVEIDSGSGCIVEKIRSTDHTGGEGYGFYFQNAPEQVLTDCVADNNAQSNYFLQNSNVTLQCINCISTRAGGYHWDNRSGSDAVVLINCAYYTATSGLAPVTPTVVINLQALTGMPYTGSGNYNLNATAGAGAACRGVLTPVISGLSDTDYRDIGAVQHQDAGGGGGNSVFGSGVIRRAA